jgi:hypothetical protein
MNRTLRPLTALAAVALIGAACSSVPSPTAASGRGNGSGASAGLSGSDLQKAVAFAKCMRDNGVSGFPDPDASGSFTIDAIANGSSVDPSSVAFQRAVGACKDIEPAGFTGFKRSAQQQEAALKFAQCIRDNGVPDFPDPTVDDPLVDTNRIPSTATPNGLSLLNAAMQKCGQFATAAGVTGSK